MGSFGHERCAGLIRGIQAFHMDTRGWDDLAYSAMVCPHGELFEGRGPGIRTAANGTSSGNDRYYAVCYLGGEGDPFTPAAKARINDAIAWLGGGDVRPHSWFKATACPGDEIRRWLSAGRPVDGGPHPTVHETLRRGARGAVVVHMQELLVAAGHDLSHVGGADGQFGPGTERELRAYQAARGLAVDGICGPVTWTSLHGGGSRVHEPGREEAVVSPSAGDEEWGTEEYHGHRIEILSRRPSAREHDASEAEPVLIIDGKEIAYDRLPDGSYFLRDYAFDWRDNLRDLAQAFVDYRTAADRIRRASAPHEG